MTSVFTARESGLTIDPAIVRQAIEWVAILQSGCATEADQHACLSWRQKDAAHERAWRRVSALGGDLRSGMMAVTPKQARRILHDPVCNRRAALKAVLGAAVLGGGLWAAEQKMSLPGWYADYRTDTGELRTVALTDGTQMMLGSDSAVDARVDTLACSIVFYNGDLQVSASRDGQRKSVSVEAAAGILRTGDGVFALRYDPSVASTVRLAVTEGSVELSLIGQQFAQRIYAGQQVRYTKGHMSAPQALDTQALAWTQGLIMAERMKLGEFAVELNRYREGNLRCDQMVAGLIVSGAFPLRDPDSVLAALEEVLPIRMRSFTRYWTTIVPA